MVRIKLTGDYDADFKAADQLAGFKTRPAGYVWHHHQDLGIMMLVDRDVHRAVPHSGGVSFYNSLVDAGVLSGSKYR